MLQHFNNETGLKAHGTKISPHRQPCAIFNKITTLRTIEPLPHDKFQTSLIKRFPRRNQTQALFYDRIAHKAARYALVRRVSGGRDFVQALGF